MININARLRSSRLLQLTVTVITSVGCSLFGAEQTGTPLAVQLMPDLNGYVTIEGLTLQEYLAGFAEGAALLAGNPEMIPLIEKVEDSFACYQEAGALNIRLFSDATAPLSAGAIAIADRNRLFDPQTLLRCIGGAFVPFTAQPSLRPCSHSYTLQRDDSELYILFVGTTSEICQEFCAHLEGCQDS